MPMFVLPRRPRPVVPADHPLVAQIVNLPPDPNIHAAFDILHTVLGAEGYRLGVKYLDAGIYVPRGDMIPRKVTKDPIHVLFPKFRPVPHPTDDKYPHPPISPEDAASCLLAMQTAQRKFGLFERESKDWEERGWTSKFDPDHLSWHASNGYVTPLHSRFYYVSIDDVNSDAKRQILADLDIRPALVITTSIDPVSGDDNDQWTIKIHKLPEHRQELDLITHFARHLEKPSDAEAATKLAQKLNIMAGDPKVKSCSRDFRIPGFYNLKSKYITKNIYHITVIKHAEDVVCPITEAMYHEIHAGIEKASAKRICPVSRPPAAYTTGTARAVTRPAGAIAPARAADPDFYPENPLYMAHAAEIQARDPSDRDLAPGRHRSKYYVLQRLILTGSLDGIDQSTDLFKDAERYLKDRERGRLYIYFRTENGVDDYHNDRPLVPESFNAHYQDALTFHGNHERAVKDAARRMFFMLHSRSVIERTLVEAGVENAAEIAAWACSPTNSQIQSVAKRLLFWERIENRAGMGGAAGIPAKP